MDRKKYIVEASDDVKKVMAMGVTHGGAIWTDTTDIESLEELNSDYINEHFGDLQDDAYNKGYAQCQDDYSDALKHAKDTAYKKGLHDGESKCGYCNEYQRGLDAAWAAARKIADMWTRMDNDELLAIFGITERIGHSTINSLFGKQTANEAMLELEAYEEKQKADDEIRVGDVVRWKDKDINDGPALITWIGGKDGKQCNVMCDDGSSGVWNTDEFVKTGRHFDIDKILAEMRT